MKMLKQKMLAMLLVLTMLVSICGCGMYSYDTDAMNQGDGGQQEMEQEAPEENGTSVKVNASDAEVIQLVKDAYLSVFGENSKTDDSQWMKDTCSEWYNAMQSVNASNCSENVRYLLEEGKLFLSEVYDVYQMSDELIAYGEKIGTIFATDVNVNMEAITTEEELVTAVNTVSTQSAQLSELGDQKFFKPTVDKLAKIYERYAFVLAEYYYAYATNDFLEGRSSFAFYDEIKSQADSVITEIDTMMTEYSAHLESLTNRMTSVATELAVNIDYAQNGNYEQMSFAYLFEEAKVTSTVSCVETIYPAMYNRQDAVAIVTLSCAQGESDVLISAEIDGFTQKYEQTVTVGKEPQRILIKPPVLSTGINLDNQKETQLKVTIADVETGKVFVSESQNVTIMSINDFILSNDEYGYTNYADILAWVTPESAQIQNVLRVAAAEMKSFGASEGIVGYQKVGSLDALNGTKIQTYAIQKAISDLGVRYVMSHYSIGEAKNQTQRVNRPDETLSSLSGICIETSVLMASALQAAGFDTMIVLTTGHCQVAVETGNNSGDYLLIETTALEIGDPFAEVGDKMLVDIVCEYKTDEEWKEYLAAKNGVVYSCDMATELGITPLIY